MNRVFEPVPFCWMCSRESGKRTREHVFPQWLLREMPKSMQTFEPVRFTRDGQTGSHRGPLGASALVAGSVCGLCNHGWMSSLEGAVQPMLRGQRDVVSGDELEALTRWFVKTAVIINVSQPYRLLWDAERRHKVATGIPANLRVSLYRVPEPDLNWRQGRLPFAIAPAGGDTSRLALLIERTHVCEIQVGTLVGLVVALPWQLSTATVDAPGSVLWPATEAIQLDNLPKEARAFDGITHLTTRSSGFWR